MESSLLDRITTHPQVFNGRPFVRGHEVTVERVLGLFAAGESEESILRRHPGLTTDDVRACLVYARRLVAYAGSVVSIR